MFEGVGAVQQEVGGDVPAVLAGAGRGLAEAAERAGELWQCSTDQVLDVLRAAQEARAGAERVLVAVVREAAGRGLHVDAGMGLADFVGVHCPWLCRAERLQLVRVAAQLGEPRNGVVAAAVAAGDLPVARADVLLRALGRVEPFVDHDTYRRDAAILLPLAVAGMDAELKRATAHLIDLVTPEHTAEELADRRHRARNLFQSSLAGGMTRFVIEADPEGAAALKALFASALTLPRPGPEVGADGDPVSGACGGGAGGAVAGRDDRTPGQRRYDALMTVLERGLSHPEGVGTTARVSMMVTVDYDVLAGRLGRSGTTSEGAVLTAGQLRRLACQAEILPAVLGGQSQLLDLGRSHRLATPGQLRALYHRDRGCTFPGCTMPPQWTQAHHARLWWARGGRTDLADMALLCRRHHTWVHQHDPALTVTPTGVTWHLDQLRGPGHTAPVLAHDDSPRSLRVTASEQVGARTVPHATTATPHTVRLHRQRQPIGQRRGPRTGRAPGVVPDQVPTCRQGTSRAARAPSPQAPAGRPARPPPGQVETS